MGFGARFWLARRRQRDSLASVPSALIIDADQDATTNIETTLKPYGFEITSTQDKEEAMSIARDATPAIIFLRVELPNASGFSVCNKLRRSDDIKDIPLVMYASGVSDDVFNQHRTLKTHADAYLKFPFAGDTLVDAVREHVSLGEPAEVEPAESSGLDVDLEDLDEDLDAADAADAADTEEPAEDAAASSGLDMPEFDEEFAEMDEELGEETDAAFDALMGGGGEEPAAPAAEAAPQAEPEPASEPEPEPASEPEPEPEAVMETEASDLSDSDAATEFKAQREVISLKSQVNAKNREILSLKDELESQERGVLDAKHKNRELLSQIGDLEEKLLLLEDSKLTSQEQSKAAVRDKNTILKREEGLKTRFDHTQKKLKEVEEQLAEAAAARDEATTNAASTSSQLEAVRNELTSAENASAQLGEQLEELRGRTASLESDLNESKASADATRTELEGTKTELETAKSDVESVKAQAEADIAAKEEAAKQSTNEQVAKSIASQAAEHMAEVEFAEAQHRAALEKVTADAEETERNARAEVEKLRAELTSAELSAQTERDALKKELEDEKNNSAEAVGGMQTKLDEQQTELESLSGQSDDLRAKLDAITTTLSTRRDAERRASQALAVALKVLDGHG